MDPELMLIRHAQSLWNAEGRWQGHGDPPLSESGLAQAEALARRVDDWRPDRLLSSDLRRALETARILGRAWDRAPEPDGRYRELDIGRWTGLSRSEIERIDPERLARFDAGDPDVRPGGGESRREIRLRARRAIEALASGCAGASRIAIVTHLGFLRALIPGIEPDNAAVVRISVDALLRCRELGGETSPDPAVGSL